jgi:enoyl-CoA hydratase/carnithine racemase
MSDDDLVVDISDRIAVLTFNRPSVKNAFTLEMMDRCAAVIAEADADDAIGALVVTGAGDAFCSGIELGALAAVPNHPVAHKKMLTDRVHGVLRALDECEIPVIAAINGPAVGAGLDMALACDLRLAARSARMSEGYIRVGLVPGDGGCFYLPQLVGLGRALDLLMTGRFVDADEAERIGMVTRVVDDGALLDEARDLAARLARLPVTQLGMIKRASRSSARMGLRDHLDLMSSHLGLAMSTSGVQDLLASQRPQD